MIKQIAHIACLTIFSILMLAAIAGAQEFSYKGEEEGEELEANEEMMELMYKYDLPVVGEIAEVSYEKLPIPVKKYLMKSQFSDWTVAQAFKVAEPDDDSVAYVLFVEQEGYLEQLTITPKGKLVEN